MTKASGPRIAIRYCTQCHWLLRAAWMAQELLSTFGTDLGEVSLQPGTGGVFVITYDGEVIWSRQTDGGFPDVKQLEQLGGESADGEARSGPSFALEPQQRASRGSSDFIRPSGNSPHQEAGHMTEGRQPFTAEIKTLANGRSTYANGPSTYDPLENAIRRLQPSLGNGRLPDFHCKSSGTICCEGE